MKKYQLWNVGDYFLSIIGFIDGALGAFPSDSNIFFCNGNTTAARLHIENMIDDIILAESDDAVTELSSAIGYTKEICSECQLGISAQIDPTTYGQTYSDPIFYLKNLLYNAGFMFSDVLLMVVYNDSNTDDYSYEVSYLAGDFIVRFFYRNTT